MATKKKTADKHPGGRPTDYREEHPEQARKLCLLGATDKELADFFGIAESTLHLWKKKHAEFSEAIKAGKDQADAEVANKLYHRALGYKAKDTKFATHEGIITDEREYIKHYPPDPTAAIFWLKNRQKGKWRDKQEHEVSGEVHHQHTHEVKEGMSFDAIQERRGKLDERGRLH